MLTGLLRIMGYMPDKEVKLAVLYDHTNHAYCCWGFSLSLLLTLYKPMPKLAGWRSPEQ